MTKKEIARRILEIDETLEQEKFRIAKKKAHTAEFENFLIGELNGLQTAIDLIENLMIDMEEI